MFKNDKELIIVRKFINEKKKSWLKIEKEIFNKRLLIKRNEKIVKLFFRRIKVKVKMEIIWKIIKIV